MGVVLTGDAHRRIGRVVRHVERQIGEQGQAAQTPPATECVWVRCTDSEPDENGDYPGVVTFWSETAGDWQDYSACALRSASVVEAGGFANGQRYLARPGGTRSDGSQVYLALADRSAAQEVSHASAPAPMPGFFNPEIDVSYSDVTRVKFMYPFWITSIVDEEGAGTGRTVRVWLRPADLNYPGVVTTGSQTFSGTKSFASVGATSVTANFLEGKSEARIGGDGILLEYTWFNTGADRIGGEVSLLHGDSGVGVSDNHLLVAQRGDDEDDPINGLVIEWGDNTLSGDASRGTVYLHSRTVRSDLERFLPNIPAVDNLGRIVAHYATVSAGGSVVEGFTSTQAGLVFQRGIYTGGSFNGNITSIDGGAI